MHLCMCVCVQHACAQMCAYGFPQATLIVAMFYLTSLVTIGNSSIAFLNLIFVSENWIFFQILKNLFVSDF